MKSRIAAIAAFIALVIPTVCLAIPAHPGGYVSGFIGVSIPRDSEVTSFNYYDYSIYDDNVEFDPGLSVGGTGGYDFGFTRLEGEISFRYSEIAKITEVTGFQYQNPDGNLGSLSMMFNAFFDIHNDSPVTPYFGGGIGFATLSINNTYGVAVHGNYAEPVLLYPSSDTTVFAYQLGAGMEVALNRKLSLDIGYRYFGTAKGTFDNDLYQTFDMKFESHNATMGIRVKF